jgi:type VI secretion system protein ImpA
MSPLDAIMLPDLSDEAPAGENLELDPDFDALERAAQGKPETQYGDTITPSTPPDWKETEAIALALMERTRDLRVMTHLAVARLHMSGVPGFAGVLGQIRSQLENRWQQVHPQLDPEDNHDPALRANALLRLRDPANVLRPLRDLPLAGAPAKGMISWRDIAIARGISAPEAGRQKLSDASIRSAFQETAPERLRTLRDTLEQAVEEVAAISAAFNTHAGPGTGPDLTDLAKLLGDIRKELPSIEVVPAEATDEQGIDAPQPDDAPSAEERPPDHRPSSAPARGPISVRSITAVTSREDALHLLELASSYFRANEPSSPLPMLIDRARRLSTMDFLDILRDLAPDGLSQAQIVAGDPTGSDQGTTQQS